MRAAASSTASGRLSSRRQSSAMSSLGLEPGAGAEELDRLRLCQRRHRILDLPPDAQQLPARHQEAEVRAGLEQRSRAPARPRPPARSCPAAGAARARRCARPGRPWPPTSGATLSATSAGSRSSGEPDPEDAVPEPRHQLGRRLDRQPRLPRTTRAGQRHQPRAVPQQLHDVRHLTLPADERRRRPRQVRVRDRLQRRKALLAELEDPHGLREVLQPVLAEIRQLSVDERTRRLRDKHLAAVRLRRRSAPPGGRPRRHSPPYRRAGARCARPCARGSDRRTAPVGPRRRPRPPRAPTGTHRRTRPPACRPPPRRAARTPPATAAGGRRAPPHMPPRPARSAGVWNPRCR